jgi:glycosyltransferase involved in cell wall biosynthesis
MRTRTESIRLLGFAPSLGGGGAEMSLLRLLNHLDRDRFCPSVAVGRSGGAYEGRLAADVERHVLCEGPLWSSTGRLLRALLPLRRLIRRKQPDVVFSVMDVANVALLLAVGGMQPRPRVVLSVQNNPRVKYDGEAFAPVKAATFFLMSRLYDRADGIVAISKGVERELTAMVPAARDRTAVIHNAGVDETVRRKARRPVEHDTPKKASAEKVVVACGRLIEQKGFEYLLEAFARLHRRGVSAQLWILGEGTRRAMLERRARELGIDERVWMPGFVDNPYRFMAAADVFALSSLWEGFGNVVAEAMACGAPVVTTDCPHGPAEIVEGGASGRLVPPRDPDALAEALEEVLTDEALRERLAAAGRERAHDFAADRVAERHGALFRHLMGDPSAADDVSV